MFRMVRHLGLLEAAQQTIVMEKIRALLELSGATA